MRGLCGPSSASHTSLASGQQQCLHRPALRQHHQRRHRKLDSIVGRSMMTSSIGESLAVVKRLKELMEGLPPLSSRTPGNGKYEPVLQASKY